MRPFQTFQFSTNVLCFRAISPITWFVENVLCAIYKFIYMCVYVCVSRFLYFFFQNGTKIKGHFLRTIQLHCEQNVGDERKNEAQHECQIWYSVLPNEINKSDQKFKVLLLMLVHFFCCCFVRSFHSFAAKYHQSNDQTDFYGHSIWCIRYVCVGALTTEDFATQSNYVTLGIRSNDSAAFNASIIFYTYSIRRHCRTTTKKARKKNGEWLICPSKSCHCASAMTFSSRWFFFWCCCCNINWCTLCRAHSNGVVPLKRLWNCLIGNSSVLTYNCQIDFTISSLSYFEIDATSINSWITLLRILYCQFTWLLFE